MSSVFLIFVVNGGNRLAIMNYYVEKHLEHPFFSVVNPSEFIVVPELSNFIFIYKTKGRAKEKRLGNGYLRI